MDNSEPPRRRRSSRRTGQTHALPTPPVITRPPLLPLEQLDWQTFEDLCSKLAEQSGVVERVQKHGRSGQAQEGVDIYVRFAHDTRYGCWQCKKYATVRAADIAKAVSSFLSGSWADKASEYYFCTSASLSDTSLTAQIESQRFLLAEPGIKFVALGKEGISEKLRNAPDLVERFFGAGWAQAFCPDYAGPTQNVRTRLWQQLPKTPEPFLLLDWRVRLSQHKGRAKELSSLLAWACDAQPLGVRLVTGPGGSGKTRLAAELSDRLRRRGWRTGFLGSGGCLGAWPLSGPSLLVIDYPEERGPELADFFENLADAHPRGPWRVLLLSRENEEWWRTKTPFARSQLAHLLDTVDLKLQDLKEEDSTIVFQGVVRQLQRRYKRSSPVPSKEAIATWFRQEKQLHRLPLFVVATAIHAVLYPEAMLGLGARNVVLALVRRERDHLNLAGKTIGLGERTAARLLALATLRGQLDAASVRRLANPRLEFGCPAPDRVIDVLLNSPIWKDGAVSVRDTIPDIFASALLFEVLCERRDVAPEWLWAVLQDHGKATRQSLARIVYDIKTVFGQKENILETWLVAMIRAEPKRAEALAALAEVRRPAAFMLPVVIEISERLANASVGHEPLHSIWRTHLAYHLWEAQRYTEALVQVDWARESTAASRDHSVIPKHILADTFHILSLILDNLGRGAEALKACDDSLALWRELAATGDAAARGGLGLCLNQRALLLKDSKESVGDLREAESTYRVLVKSSFVEFGDHLARILFNLSTREKDPRRACELLRESVDIRRELAAKEPWRYEAGLALSLHQYAVTLQKVKHHTQAAQFISEAIQIREKMVQVNPARFAAPFLASLWSKAFIAGHAGDQNIIAEAANAAVRCEALFDERTLSGDEALAELGRTYAHIGYMTANVGADVRLGVKVCTSAVSILESLQRKEPDEWNARRHLILVGAHINRANSLIRSDRAAAIGDYSKAIGLVEEGRPRFGFVASLEIAAEIALANRAGERFEDGTDEEGLDDCRLLIEAERTLCSELGEQWPLSEHLELGKSLRSLIKLLDAKSPEVAVCLLEIQMKIQHALDTNELGPTDRVGRTGNRLALGLQYLKLGRAEAASEYLRRGIAEATDILDRWTEDDGAAAKKADFINTVNYYVCNALERGQLVLNDLMSAEQMQRECLRLIESEDGRAPKDRSFLWGAARDTLGSILHNRAVATNDARILEQARAVLQEALRFFDERGELAAVAQVREELSRTLIARAQHMG